MAAVDLGQIKGDHDLSLGDAVVVGGQEVLLEAAIRLALHLAGGFDGGRSVGQDRDQPFTAAVALNGKAAGLDQGELLTEFGGGGNFGAARDGFGEDERARFAVKAQRYAGAGGQGYGFVGLVGEVEGGLAGIGGGLGPAFPCGARGGLRHTARCQVGQRRHAPERTEEQRHDQQGQRHVAQTVPVARGQPQVRFDRAGGGGADGHAGTVRLPDLLRGGVGAADGLGVAQGRDGAAGQGGIEPRQSLIPGRAAEFAQPVDRRPQDAGKRGDQAEPAGLQREMIKRVKGQEAKRGNHKRPERPEGTCQPFRPKTDQGQAEGKFDPFEGLFRLALVHMPFAIMTASQPFGNAIPLQDFVKGRAGPDDGEVIPGHQNLWHQGAGVVL